MNAYTRERDLQRRIKVVEWFLYWHNDEIKRIERSGGIHKGIVYDVKRYKKARMLLIDLRFALYYANKGIFYS